MIRAAIVALLALTACGGSTEPSRALPVGTYDYSTTTGLTGTLTITSSTPEGVTGTWAVVRAIARDTVFRAPVESIGWNLDAFVVIALPSVAWMNAHNHRLVRSGDGVLCTGIHVLVGPFGCTLTRR
jgi:hypothetical protein